ncbi:MAG: aminopeptidase P family N-terminal domain-containing protein, partial [Alphaproteobacteria bacterium]|nr:aminopeptidase P family N-terminal domain-containing protein [Alphaproteobacteria bacterium]
MPPKESSSEKLARLRAELGRQNFAGFVVPRADEHQGEYVPPSAARLGWLTGFTGSAGLAVVLRDKAAVFVDGRYTLQAEAQVEGALYERRHLVEQPATDWIAANLKAGETLAYDPWLLTPGEVERYRAACARAGGKL